MDSSFPCPFCQFPVIPAFYFCPNCGKKLKEPPFSMSAVKIIGLLAMSLLLPPLGLWPGIKLLFKNDRKGQLVGLTAIFITALATIITTWLTINFVNSQLNSAQTQFNPYQSLGL